MNKTALITGIKGQDGAYLSKLLIDKGYRVIGTDRRRVDIDNWRLRKLGIENQVEFEYMDLLDNGNMFRVMKKYQPDEVYNLAAQSFVGVSFEQPILTSEVDGMGVLKLLEAVRTFSPESKFYQASTSEMFGNVLDVPQSETTPFNPRSPYGVAKVFAHFITKNYRESYNMACCSGILFNHESPLRGLEFVTRKITHGVARIKLGLQDKITLGNMNAQRDWGFAGDYVKGMWLMLQQEVMDDYVLSTGKTTTVRKFVDAAFQCAGIPINWEGEEVNEVGKDSANQVRVDVSEKFFRPAEVDLLIGDSSKAKKELNWSPEVTLEKLVEMMYRNDYDMVSKQQ